MTVSVLCSTYGDPDGDHTVSVEIVPLTVVGPDAVTVWIVSAGFTGAGGDAGVVADAGNCNPGIVAWAASMPATRQPHTTAPRTRRAATANASFDIGPAPETLEGVLARTLSGE